MKSSAFLALGLVFLGLSSGCVISGQQTLDLSVSTETARILKDIDSTLAAQGAEVRISCRGTACKVRIDGNRQPQLENEMVNHPLEGTPMVHRIHGGTQALTGALYEALGRHVPTTDFQGRADERELLLETTSTQEGQGLKFRCVSDRATAPTFDCWILVSARILR